MAQTTNQKWEKALAREGNLEDFLNQKLDEIDAALGSVFIAGLKLEWVSGSSVKVKTGAAWVSGAGILRVAADITVSSISLGASAWGHVYLYKHVTTGAATIEVVTTEPILYLGTAYQKTGDATRRYLGSVRTDAAGAVYNFIHYPQTGFVRYRDNAAAAPFVLVSASTLTAETTVVCSSVAPVTSRLVQVRFANSANQAAQFGTSDDTGAAVMNAIAASADKDCPMPIDSTSSRAFTYKMAAAVGSGSLSIFAHGYYFER